MKRKGQAAIEYVTTYGWAILVISIIGIVIWQLGLYHMTSRIEPGYSGFSILVPIEWWVASPGVGTNCTLNVVVANGAGEPLEALEVLNGAECIPSLVSTGNLSRCFKTLGECGKPGTPFEGEMTITYQREDGQTFQNTGKVWGNVEQ